MNETKSFWKHDEIWPVAAGVGSTNLGQEEHKGHGYAISNPIA
jgi:hypothetical protein